MVKETRHAVSTAIQEWDQGAWCLAAIALRGQGQSDPRLRAAADVVLEGLHLLDADGQLAGVPAEAVRQVAGQASAPLLLTSALARGAAVSWADQSDEALIAQGQMSGRMAGAQQY